MLFYFGPGPGIQITGWLSLVGLGNNQRTEDHYEALNTTSILRGPHLLKSGSTSTTSTIRFHYGFAGYYIFPSLRAFLTGTPDEYQQSWGSPRTEFAVTNYAGLVQDLWTIIFIVRAIPGIVRMVEADRFYQTMARRVRLLKTRVRPHSDEWRRVHCHSSGKQG